MGKSLYRCAGPFVIYRVTNPANGKIYIGVTARTAGRRWIEHVSTAMAGKTPGRLFQAIRKHGREAFIVETLATFGDADEALAEEVRLIADLQPDYNSSPGGGYPPPLTENGLARLRQSAIDYPRRLGTKTSDVAKAKIRDAQLRPEIRAAWTERAKAGPKAIQRPVVCVDDGKNYESASLAAKAYGVARSALIELCLGQRGRRTVGGRKFTYVEA